MVSENDLMAKIEQLRIELGRLVLKYGIHSPQVLVMSQQLDEVLSQYYKKVLNKESN